MGFAGNISAIYKVHKYVTACIYTCTTCQVHSCCKLFKPATSVYIVHEQLIHHQPVRTYVRSKDFPICVVHALFHTQAFFKFKIKLYHITLHSHWLIIAKWQFTATVFTYATILCVQYMNTSP